MRRFRILTFQAFTALMLVTGLTGCDSFGEVFDRDQETSGVIEQIGADFLVVDGIRYVITSDTEFEGIEGLGDLAVGDEVDVEYEGDGSERTALEVEFGEDENEDDDGGFLG